MTQIVEHHIHYKEIHGYDETIMMTKSEHQKLHIRLRNEGECNIPVNELSKISKAASGRAGNTKGYHNKNIKCKKFSYPMKPYINLRTAIKYNEKLNSLSISSWFEGSRPNKMYFIEI